MTSRPLFDEDGWLGGFYELAMELGPRSDERLRAAGEALWSHPALEGPYGERNVPPDRQQRVGVDRLLCDGEHLYGVATLSRSVQVPCGTLAFRDGPETVRGSAEPEGTDNLCLYLPIEGLARVWPEAGGFPFNEATAVHEWIPPVEAWLAGVARAVYRRVEFRVASIGFENEVSSLEWQQWREHGVPADPPFGILWPEDGELEWHPVRSFSIAFMPAERSRGSAERIGRIVLGTFEERFRASLEHWGVPDYERHWRHALARLLEGSPSCLITNMVEPTGRGDNLEWWPAWPLGEEAIFHQEHVRLARLDPPFDPDDPYVHLEEYDPSDAEAGVSEWRVPLRAIRDFVAATA